jgi:hypothetical protein
MQSAFAMHLIALCSRRVIILPPFTISKHFGNCYDSLELYLAVHFNFSAMKNTILKILNRPSGKLCYEYPLRLAVIRRSKWVNISHCRH